MKYDYISSFKILEDFKIEIEIEFDGRILHTYIGVSDISINREKDDMYTYTVIDYFTYTITLDKPTFLKKLFPVKCKQDFFDSEIDGKMNFLQIEGS